MEIRNLNYFRVIAKEQNLTHASKILHITQPALSKSLSDLEDELGVELFTRKKGRIVLNASGTMFLSFVERALDEISVGEQMLKSRGASTAVQNNVIVSVYAPIIPNSFIEYNRHSPHVEGDTTFTFLHEDATSLFEHLSGGLVHFAASIVPSDSPDIECTPLFNDGVLCMVSENHPLFGRQFVTLDELQQYQLQLTDFGMDFDSEFEKFWALNHKTPKIIAKRESIKRLDTIESVNSGECVLLQPTSTLLTRDVQRAAECPVTLKVLPIVNPSPSFPVYILRNRNAFKNMAVQYHFYSFITLLGTIGKNIDIVENYLRSGGDETISGLKKSLDTMANKSVYSTPVSAV